MYKRSIDYFKYIENKNQYKKDKKIYEDYNI